MGLAYSDRCQDAGKENLFWVCLFKGVGEMLCVDGVLVHPD